MKGWLHMSAAFRLAAMVLALAAAYFFMSREAVSMSASDEAREIPAIDREAPAAVRTATFALG